jgi:membrane associated rhomboid family serine protease
LRFPACKHTIVVEEQLVAFRSNGTVTLTFPPFRGVTRRIILIAVVAFFAFALLAIVNGEMYRLATSMVILQPWMALRRLPWTLLTYAFYPTGLLSSLFAMLSIWFFGSALEDERGSRWLTEYFLVSTIGGGLLASVVSFAIGSHAPELGPRNVAVGLWPAVLATVLAYARFHAEDQLRFNFIFVMKAKYIAALYLLVYLALTLVGNDRFGAMTAVCSAVAGFVYLRFLPQRGVAFAGSEWWYSLRNTYYRAKRRRAAKKFTVYMKKQGKDVSFDDKGRYVDPTGHPRDPNDRRWMN